MYWRDLNEELFAYVTKFPKAIIVSAGFIYDPNFVHKTKSLLLLADLVVTDEIGTSVGYALYLGKSVDYIATQDIRINNLIGETLNRDLENKEQIGKAIINNDYVKLDFLYNQFWSPDRIKSSEEIRTILEGLDEIKLTARFNKEKYDDIILNMIKKWSVDTNSRKKSQLFLEALGSSCTL